MSKFISACNYTICEKLCVNDSITVDFTANEGVVNLMNFSQKAWYCDDCKIDFGTGDMEDTIEIL